MALDSFLYITTQKEINEIRECLIEYLDYKFDSETDYIIKEGLYLHISNISRDRTRDKSYGVSPTISIYFRLDKFEEFEQGYRNMVETIMFLLEYYVTEAIMYDSGSRVDLIFKDGKLVLQKDNWDEQGLLLVNLPYEILEIEDK